MAHRLRATASGPYSWHGVRRGDDEIVVDDLNLLGLPPDSAAVQPLADPTSFDPTPGSPLEATNGRSGFVSDMTAYR
jgi:hypothetical protein